MAKKASSRPREKDGPRERVSSERIAAPAGRGKEVSRNRGVAGVTRARARELDKLVGEIVDAIIANTWGPRPAAEMARREGVDPSTVDNWAGAAARALRMAPDIEARRGMHLARLDQAWESAHKLADPKAAVSAIAEANKMLGLHAPAKAEVSVTVRAFAQLGPAEMLAKVREQRRALEALEADLVQQLGDAGAITVPALPAKEG